MINLPCHKNVFKRTEKTPNPRNDEAWYMEMAKINLAIASEAIQAEYEAEHTVESLVSGG